MIDPNKFLFVSYLESNISDLMIPMVGELFIIVVYNNMYDFTVFFFMCVDRCCVVVDLGLYCDEVFVLYF